MSEKNKAGLRRPRVLVTILVGLTVLLAAGGWTFQRMTRVGSGYAYVRGDVVLVGAPLEGQLATVDVVPGQHVKKGDVLARLRDEALRPEVDRAAAVAERARLAVDAEQIDITVERKHIVAERVRLGEKLAATGALADVARIAARHARRQAERSQMLAAQSYIPVADDDTAKAESESAEAEALRRRAEKGEARAELAGLSVAEAEVEARVQKLGLLKAEAAGAKAALDTAQGRLDMTVIRAQHDGVVTRTILGPGASIRFSDPIVEMRLDGPLAIEAWVDERDLGHVSVGAPVRVSFRGLDETFSGKIDAVAMVSDAEVRSVSVTVPVGNRLAKSRWMRAHIVLDRPDERLVPGLSAEVTLARAAHLEK